MVNLICNKLFILAPLYFKQTSGGSAFIVTTLVFGLTLLLWNLYHKYCNTAIILTINNHKIKNIIIAFVSILCSLIIATTIQQYSLVLKSTVLQKTPTLIISILFISAALIGNTCSLKCIGIASVIFVPLTYVIANILLILSVSLNDTSNFFPLFDTMNSKILQDILLMQSMQFELFFMFFIPDFLIDVTKTKKTGNHVITLSYICYLIISIVYSITMPGVSNQSYEPFFRIIRMSRIGNTTANFDSIFLVLYCISAYIYLSSMFALVNKMIDLSSKKAIISPLKLISFLVITVFTLNDFLGKYIFEIFSKYYGVLLIITFIVPTIFILLSRMQKCKVKN